MGNPKKRKSGKPAVPALRFRNNPALLRNVLENAAVPTCLVDESGDVVYANRAFSDLLGYQPGECVGLGVAQIIHPEEAGSVRAQIENVVGAKAAGYQAERRYLRKNGAPIWVLASASALPSAPGDPAYLTVQAIDIDRQKRAEAALAESESRWNFALESAGQGVWDHDL